MLNTKKKLVLSVETLRNLTNGEAASVEGGGITRFRTIQTCQQCPTAGTQSFQTTKVVPCC